MTEKANSQMPKPPFRNAAPAIMMALKFCLFGSPTSFRDRFKRLVGTSPQACRCTFRSSGPLTAEFVLRIKSCPPGYGNVLTIRSQSLACVQEDVGFRIWKGRVGSLDNRALRRTALPARRTDSTYLGNERVGKDEHERTE